MVGVRIPLGEALAPAEVALIRSALILMAESDAGLPLPERSLVERIIDRLDTPCAEMIA